MSSAFGRLKETFLASPVVDMNGYPYFVNPISDGIPEMDAALLGEVVDGLVDITCSDCDMILAPEAMGLPLATGMTLRTGIPLSVIRKRRYGLPGEIALDQTTGYSRSPMYINGVSKGDRVVIVDDVVSTGGTLRAIIDALICNGVEVVGVSVVYDKSDDLRSVEKDLCVPIRSLIRVGVVDGRPVIRE
ncbi:MAG: hypoxanthine/guanine phosphoribosyltransferase [Candidatus Methanomethylophilaceae archaeon]